MLQLPKTHVEPTQIAPDTFVIHDHHGEGGPGPMIPLNSMVIRAAEPVVVDTGVAENRERYFADLFGIVDPVDIRWVFLSHDDIDHTGNVNELMALAPNATLVTNWFMVERMGESLAVPPHRMRWVGDGESFSAGDRVLHAVRPPVYDAPTTRGVFDTETGVYWASDSFAALMPEIATNAAALDPELWRNTMATLHQYLSPWVSMVDDAAFQRSVDRIEALGVQTIAGCHAPTIGLGLVPSALRNMREFPSVEVPPMPGQEVLDEIVAATAVAA